MTTYFSRLNHLVAERGALCVGIDPQPSMLAAWGLTNCVEDVEFLCRSVVEACADIAAAFKPQSGFFEPYGSAGIAVLERILDDIRQSKAVSILDVKRGDIGSTMAGYARAYLEPGCLLEADAITVSPFLGFESLRPALDLASKNDKGIYVLAKTSNPEGGDVQSAQTQSGISVTQYVIEAAQRENSTTGLNHVGLVIGATHHDLGCDVSRFSGSILAPGIGAQGGTIDRMRQLFGDALASVLPTASRQIISAGPNRETIRKTAERLRLTR